MASDDDLDEVILDYLTNHGDRGAYVGDTWNDDGTDTIPGVVRFDGTIDTRDLANHIRKANHE